MQLYAFLQRELTETEKSTIARFRYYYDCKGCFALIGSYVAAVLPDSPPGEPEKQKTEALKNMTSLRNTPPDFRTYVMDDQFGLVEMNYGVYAVSPERLSKEEIESGKVGLSTALAVRALCLEACETGQIIAIVDEEA